MKTPAPIAMMMQATMGTSYQAFRTPIRQEDTVSVAPTERS